VVVGHPGDRRVAFVQAALARLGQAPAEVIAYRDLLDGRDSLTAALRPGCLVRLESPGRDFEVEKRLIALGAAEPETEDTAAAFIDAAAALRLEADRGRLRYIRQWYRGFRALLRRLRNEAAGVRGVRFLNHPDDVAAMFDKRLCQARFAAAGVPVPARLGSVGSFDGLLERMRAANRPRVFVKLAHGSAAAGAVALAVGGPRLRAVTTVEMVRTNSELALYTTRRLRVYESAAEVAPLIDALCREGVQAEAWVPKAGVDGYGFDLRVLVVAGRPRHTVARLSRTPMTNLHLLNPRGDLDRVRAAVPPDRWAAAMASAVRAARQFPASHAVGVDLLFAPGCRRHFVLEANAFGDLLPGVLCDGRDAYEDELALFQRSEGRGQRSDQPFADL
jgi:hypothetical protein